MTWEHRPLSCLLVPTDLRLELLSLLVATSHASCYWVMSKAYQHLASWSLSQFLLVTQGDLQASSGRVFWSSPSRGLLVPSACLRRLLVPDTASDG